MARKYLTDVAGVLGAGGLTNVATTHTLTSLTRGDGATVATFTSSDPSMLMSILDASGNVLEVVKLTDWNSGTKAITIVRAQEGYSAIAHAGSLKVTCDVYPSDLAPSPMGLPQGDFLRKYTFDSTTESWAATACTLSSVSGRLRVSGITNSVASLFTEPLAAADVADGEFSMDIISSTGGTSLGAGLMFRIVDTSNFYWLSFGFSRGAVPQFELYKCVAGVFTALASSANTWLPMPGVGAANARLMVRFVGTSVQAYLNDTLVLAAADSTFTTGNVGMRVFGTASQTMDVDNAYVYTLPSTWQPDAPRAA